jgi:hypothetical protein
MYERLQAVHTNNEARLQTHAVSAGETPGSTLYLFHPHAPLEVPLLWFWKCVVVAQHSEGGAPQQWLAMMTEEVDSTVPCVNVETDSTQTSTLRRHLQLQPDIYISSVTARTNIDLFADVLGALEMAFGFWNIEPLPNIHCFLTPSDGHDDWCDTSQYSYDRHCTRVFAQPTSVMPDRKDVLNSMYDLALKFLFKRSRQQIEAMNALTLQNLLDWNLAEVRNLTSDLAPSTDYSNAIPVYELTALSQDLDDLVLSQIQLYVFDPQDIKIAVHAAEFVKKQDAVNIAYIG